MPNDISSTQVSVYKNKRDVLIAPNMRNKTYESYYQVMGNSDIDMYEEIQLHIIEPIWIYARELYNGNNSSYETNDRVLQGIGLKKRHVNDFY